VLWRIRLPARQCRPGARRAERWAAAPDLHSIGTRGGPRRRQREGRRPGRSTRAPVARLRDLLHNQGGHRWNRSRAVHQPRDRSGPRW
jgi:hypothetical protein